MPRSRRKTRWPRVARHALGATVFALLFAVNPALLAGCSLLQGSFEYGEPEMMGLIESVNRTERWVFSKNGADYELVLEVEQGGKDAAKRAAVEPGVVRSADACSERSFVKSAGACLDTTTVPLIAKATLRRLGPSPELLLDKVALRGAVEVFGLRLNNARLTVKDDERTISLQSMDGKSFGLTHVVLHERGGPVQLEFSQSGG